VLKVLAAKGRENKTDYDVYKKMQLQDFFVSRPDFGGFAAVQRFAGT
jgi:hypothetical protein